jgi:hypothetical protein
VTIHDPPKKCMLHSASGSKEGLVNWYATKFG